MRPEPRPSVEHGGRRRGGGKVAQTPILDAENSAVLRERLVTECANLQTVDTAIAWARNALKTKNTLRSEDAEMLERAFAQRLGALEAVLAGSGAPTLAETTGKGPGANERDAGRNNASGGIAIASPA